VSGHGDELGRIPRCMLSAAECEVLIICCRQYLEPDAEWRLHGPFRYEVTGVIDTLRKYLQRRIPYEEAYMRHLEAADEPHA
jgi:hypothetical protein